jgi:hypothetical protein
MELTDLDLAYLEACMLRDRHKTLAGMRPHLVGEVTNDTLRTWDGKYPHIEESLVLRLRGHANAIGHILPEVHEGQAEATYATHMIRTRSHRRPPYPGSVRGGVSAKVIADAMRAQDPQLAEDREASENEARRIDKKLRDRDAAKARRAAKKAAAK